MVVAEIKLSQIPMKVLASHLVIHASDSTLEDAKHALNRVGVNRRQSSFLAAVLASAVIAKGVD
jgi:hypothetical protein